MGFPGAPMGMSQLDPSIGGLLQNLGYATGQFGKNHVGDRNESLPTVNGFARRRSSTASALPALGRDPRL